MAAHRVPVGAHLSSLLSRLRGRRASTRAFALLSAILAVVSLGVIAPSSPASAANSTTVTQSLNNGQFSVTWTLGDQYFQQGELMTLSGTWSAKTAPKAGDQFAVALNPNTPGSMIFGYRQFNITDDGPGTNGQSDGVCTVVPATDKLTATLTCQFNDNLANRTDVKGTVSLTANASQTLGGDQSLEIAETTNTSNKVALGFTITPAEHIPGGKNYVTKECFHLSDSAANGVRQVFDCEVSLPALDDSPGSVYSNWTFNDSIATGVGDFIVPGSVNFHTIGDAPGENFATGYNLTYSPAGSSTPNQITINAKKLDSTQYYKVSYKVSAITGEFFQNGATVQIDVLDKDGNVVRGGLGGDSVALWTGDATGGGVKQAPSFTTSVAHSVVNAGQQLTDVITSSNIPSNVPMTWQLWGPDTGCNPSTYASPQQAQQGTAQFDGTLNSGRGGWLAQSNVVLAAGCYYFTEHVDDSLNLRAGDSKITDANEQVQVIDQPSISTEATPAQVTLSTMPTVFTDTVTIKNLPATTPPKISWSLVPATNLSAADCSSATASTTWGAPAASGTETAVPGKDPNSWTAYPQVQNPGALITTPGCYSFVDTVPGVDGVTPGVVSPAGAPNEVITIAKAGPSVNTTAVPSAATVGDAPDLTDQVTVMGLPSNTSASLQWALNGPLPTDAQGQCPTSTDSWKGTSEYKPANGVVFHGSIDSVTSTNENYLVKLSAEQKAALVPGCYSFTEVLGGTDVSSSVTTGPGVTNETLHIVAAKPTMTTTIENKSTTVGVAGKLTDDVTVSGLPSGISTGLSWMVKQVQPVNGVCPGENDSAWSSATVF
ncbi:MAG: hypothetical protein JO147_07890, partial [Actinobacteria bacterium]|nr:hypothetical protein [Actinomycetota bacterium]